MTPEPYLIAHLVRGLPAFDIAIILDTEGTQTDPGPWWIIPTSGHRAYPYDSIELSNVTKWWIDNVPYPPEHWPDHYAISTIITAADETTGRNLAQALGLVKHEPIRRRI